MKELVTGFIDEMEYWFGMKISVKVMTRLLKENPDLVRDTLNLGLDTCSREWMANIIGKYIVGEDWPVGCDTKEYTKSFYQVLLKKAPRKGIRILKDSYREWIE